ncbi:hypothetical protein BSPLISOX_1246 [uncultured Gammaproteobacteria bacterium]|jgi:hypothetical protein|nr:hypothetical protein [uncultured Gammaproteobacteria bacterium]VVH66241.1 hypothetical protein BSPLISOX_1246 [uncultured Gammaproteobacteria bacterium]VVM26471.1 hypothetical protein BSPWISOXPB_6043 [uncultured Gammaproteobacteria bacterium]
MKLKNIFVGFLKTLLLITLFCGSLIHAANYMFLILQNYQYTANDFPPYLFEKNFETGQLTKIIDTENAFQFKTYSLASETDIESYTSNVKPVLIKWAEGDELDMGSDASTSSILSLDIIEGVDEDYLPTKEVHVAIYKGKIEAVSYTEDARQAIPEIKTLIANPEGLIEGQTKIVKGGGSSLLNYMLQRFKANNVKRVQLRSIRDKYYLDRGWEKKEETDCSGLIYLDTFQVAFFNSAIFSTGVKYPTAA